MKRFWLGIPALAVVSACSGGNPWVEDGDGGDGANTAPTIPVELAGDLSGVTYNPTAQTLTVTGVSLDNSPYEVVYTRKAALDRNGYEAYTTQDGSLDRHTTAYVRDINGTQGAIVMTRRTIRALFRRQHLFPQRHLQRPEFRATRSGTGKQRQRNLYR